MVQEHNFGSNIGDALNTHIMIEGSKLKPLGGGCHKNERFTSIISDKV